MPSLQTILKYGTSLFAASVGNSGSLNRAEMFNSNNIVSSSNYYLPSVALFSYGPHRLHAFAIGASNHGLYHQSWDDPSDISNGSGWTYLGGTIIGPPAVTAPELGNLHVFVRGGDGGVWVKYFDGNTWLPNNRDWISLGGYFTSSPAVAISGPDGVDIVGRGGDNHLWYGSTRDGYRALPWMDLGGFFSSEPSAVAWGPCRLDIFARGNDGAYWWKYRSGATWSSEWVSLGGNFSSAPVAVSKQANRITVFGIDQNGDLLHQWFDGKAWVQTWENIGGSLSSTVSVLTTTTEAGLKRFDIFGVDKANVLSRKVLTGLEWLPWEKHCKSAVSAPAVVSWSPNHLDVVALDPSGQMVHQSWDGKNWSPDITTCHQLGGNFIDFAFHQPQSALTADPRAFKELKV